jgi:transcriptional regulator GlxA family with amidase domain
MLRLGIVLFPGFQMMNLSVLSVFEFANRLADTPLYELALLSEDGGPVQGSSGFAVTTQKFDDSKFDTLIVVGDNDALVSPPAVVDFLKRSAPTVRRIGSTCTGAFNLAEAGLLDGRRATTHWFFADKMRREYPDVKIEEDRIFIIDGPVWTSATVQCGRRRA